MNILSAIQVILGATDEQLNEALAGENIQKVLKLLRRVEHLLTTRFSTSSILPCTSFRIAQPPQLDAFQSTNPAFIINQGHDPNFYESRVPDGNTSIENPNNAQGNNIRRPNGTPNKASTTTAPKRKSTLFDIIKKRLHWLLEFKEKELELIIEENKPRCWDARLDDTLSDRKNPTHEQKIFNGYAQRSLALQFTEIQQKSGKVSRVEELCDAILNLSISKETSEAVFRQKSGDSVPNFVKDHVCKDPNLRKYESAIQAVYGGLKMLVAEAVLKRRLNSNTPYQTAGLAAILALLAQFGRATFEEIGDLIDTLVANPTISLHAGKNCSISDKERPILDIISDLSTWSDEFQVAYTSSRRTSETPRQPSHKRPFPLTGNQQQDRSTIPTPHVEIEDPGQPSPPSPDEVAEDTSPTNSEPASQLSDDISSNISGAGHDQSSDASSLTDLTEYNDVNREQYGVQPLVSVASEDSSRQNMSVMQLQNPETTEILSPPLLFSSHDRPTPIEPALPSLVILGDEQRRVAQHRDKGCRSTSEVARLLSNFQQSGTAADNRYGNGPPLDNYYGHWNQSNLTGGLDRIVSEKNLAGTTFQSRHPSIATTFGATVPEPTEPRATNSSGGQGRRDTSHQGNGDDGFQQNVGAIGGQSILSSRDNPPATSQLPSSLAQPSNYVQNGAQMLNQCQPSNLPPKPSRAPPTRPGIPTSSEVPHNYETNGPAATSQTACQQSFHSTPPPISHNPSSSVSQQHVYTGLRDLSSTTEAPQLNTSGENNCDVHTNSTGFHPLDKDSSPVDQLSLLSQDPAAQVNPLSSSSITNGGGLHSLPAAAAGANCPPQSRKRKLGQESEHACDVENLSRQVFTHVSDASLINNRSVTQSLLILLYALGCSQIRQDVLFHGLRPQKRWNSDGEVHEVSLQDSGLNLQIAQLFSDQSVLENTINYCTHLGLSTRSELYDGSLAYSISDRSQRLISQSFDRKELDLLGLTFTTHIYPQDEILEPSFPHTGKLLSPYIERTWQFVEKDPCPSLPTPVRDTLVEASLAACRLVSTSRADSIISVLKPMQDPDLPDHLQMAIAYQRSISLRFKGDHDQSDVVIRDILEKVSVGSTDVRVHCAYGRLQLSRTENAIMREEFDKAKSYLASWEVKSPLPSGLELKVVRLKNTVLGRLSRYEGNFSHARHCLEECLKMIPRNASRYHIMHHLADVYCELKTPERAEELVQAEVRQLRASGKQHSRAFRRLALPLAEAYSEQKRGEEARSLFLELNKFFEGMHSLDVSDQLGHMRSMIGLARINHRDGRWSEARKLLKTALSLTEKYRTFTKGGFYVGFIYLFLSVISFQLEDVSEGLNSLALAKQIRAKQVEHFFIPGLGTYFLRDLELWAESLSRLSAVRSLSPTY